ncbi:3',5'-cyclic-nucleotide phosphodiesterase [Verticillium nonalfalfae]|uniref:Phosphodiesterase n=1 Tax=Verticillium nonalfalfae TaxID=1051616 RepID=A0A3M9YFJ9_9PEZI|nr:3',5'-cyclic-nucleotide phosphodiesterase [Verticillium nonalfalfae]RNJ58945.1 3',5'-cyclic-nucleotide phosphodiesterase [Verticillium nonalfalfae]
MDHSKLHVVYVNRRFGADRRVAAPSKEAQDANHISSELQWESEDLRQDVEVLLESFSEVHLCSTGSACLASLYDIQEGSIVDLRPTLVLIDTPDDEHIPEEPQPRSRSPSPMSRPESREVEIHTPDEEVYGLRLLQRIMTEAHLRSLSKLVVPILLIGQAIVNRGSSPQDAGSYLAGVRPVDRRLVMRCLDLGAADVILRPMHAKCVMSLEIHAHRVRKDAAKEQRAILEVRRGRKRSWVGVNEERPFAYLREAMVSSLMKGICRLPTDDDDKIANVSIAVSTERQAAIATAIGSWHFCAHDFSDDELLVAAMVMFKHALSMPQLERWRIPADQLINFLVACRAAYNSFVPYHNFRHVVDVLQATFNFLVHIGIISPYPLDLHSQAPATSPVADLLSPVDGLTLLITAIGHDVGHPGVNNGFLVTLNAPLAQLYNDRSVLESFHCAAYSQILRRYWPAVFEDSKMRNLMISSILATDMGLHFDYMKKLGDLQAKLEVNSTTDGWNGRMVEEQKALACSLLIKCADISNVARKYEAALQWMFILSDEFSRQSSMENELEIQSSLLATPKKDLVSLAKAQLGFMNMFAIPLFQGVADIMPTMQYTVDELERNKVLFEGRVHEEQAKEDPVRKRLLKEGTFSPRTMSFVVESDTQTPPTAQAGSPLADIPTPSTLTDGKKTDEKELSPPPSNPTSKPAHIPNTTEEYKEVNGGFVSDFESVTDFAASDPFHSREQLSSMPDHPTQQNSKQRCSETTDGSAAGHVSGDWASQATSATTGKMPLSPSTQGTSIVSRESAERRMSIPVIAEPKDPYGSKAESLLHTQESNGSNGSIGKAEGAKVLRKKTSRFRMNNFPFFRRNRGASPSLSASDTTGGSQ